MVQQQSARPDAEEKSGPAAVLAVHKDDGDGRCAAPKCNGEAYPCVPAQSAQRLLAPED